MAPLSAPPPRTIVCVGRNYRAHARELGNDPPPEPLVFLKPPSAVIGSGEPIVRPGWAGRVDYEGEIAFSVSRRARRVRASEAWDYLGAVFALNDVTARELQRRDGQWSRAKGFDTFCPVGPALRIDEVALDDLTVVTRLDGRVVQKAPISDQIFPVPVVVEYITRFMTLEPGDWISTGTPEGVGPLEPGSRVEVAIPGVSRVENPVIAEEGV